MEKENKIKKLTIKECIIAESLHKQIASRYFPINLKVPLHSFHHLNTGEILGKHYI